MFCPASPADGDVLAGGQFTARGELSRAALSRWGNRGPVRDHFRFHGPTITWLRGGSGPEASRTRLDYSADGVTWASLGPGTRVPGGWRWTQAGQTLLPANTVLLRARGFVPGTGWSGWLVESGLRLPDISPDNVGFEAAAGCFGFPVCGLPGQTVVVQASSNLRDWTALATNALTSDSWFAFRDGASQRLPRRFYRVKLWPP